MIGVKKALVKYWMNITPCFVQFQAIRSESLLFDDLEGSILFVIKFLDGRSVWMLVASSRMRSPGWYSTRGRTFRSWKRFIL